MLLFDQVENTNQDKSHMNFLPLDTLTTLSSGMLGVITANIVPILGVLGFAWGIKFTTGRLNKATKGKV